MGSTATKEPQEEMEDNPPPKINHHRFQNSTFSKSKDQEEIITIRIPVANEKQYLQWVETLKDAPNNSQIGFFPRNHAFKKQGYCGSTGFAQIDYDNFPFILNDEIKNRQTLKQRFFEEPQLWYLVYTLLGAGKQFHQQNKKVGDIRPQNIFINEDGQVKVGNQFTWPSEQLNYEKTFYLKQTTYLAPEELKDLQFVKIQPTANPVLAESFSVGLTCLDAGTLTNSSSLYLKNNKFDYQALQSRLGALKQIGYSELIIMVIENLCSIDADKRCTCAELFDWLNPYEEAIINLNEFETDRIPEKLARKQQSFIPSMNQSQQVYFDPVKVQGTQKIIRTQIVGEPIRQIQNISPQKMNGPPSTVVYSQKIEYQPGSLRAYEFPQQGKVQPVLTQQQNENENRPSEPKSKMELDLDKIDEQLQMSRKMFPS